MAATVRGVTAATATNAPTSPSSTAVDDAVLVFHWTKVDGNGVPTHTLQSNFVQIFSQPHNDGSTDGRLSVAYKIATSSGANTYQAYSSDAGTDFAGIVVLTKDTFRPHALGNLGDVSAGTTGTTNAVPNPPSIVTPVADCLVFYVAAWHLTSAATVAVGVATGYAEQWEMAGSNAAELEVGTKTVATATTEDPAGITDDVTPNGTSSITFAIRPAGPIAGTADGAGTATGSLTGAGALAGTADGVGTATGTGTVTGGGDPIEGTASGTGTATGALTGEGALAGTSDGTGTATGALTGAGALAGTSDGTGTATGALSGAGTLAGTSAGEGSASGVILGLVDIAGTAAGVGAATGAADATIAAEGTAAGTGTATGALVGDGALAGLAAGVGTLSGDLLGAGALAGVAAGVGTATGRVKNAAASFPTGYQIELGGSRIACGVSSQAFALTTVI